MKLFGHHDKQTIEVTVDPDHVEPGGTVTATVRVTGPPDDKTRGVAARLVSKHRWSSKSTDDDGATTISVHTDIVVVAESGLLWRCTRTPMATRRSLPWRRSSSAAQPSASRCRPERCPPARRSAGQ